MNILAPAIFGLAKIALLYLGIRGLMGAIPLDKGKVLRGSDARLVGAAMLAVLVVGTAVVLIGRSAANRGTLPPSAALYALLTDFVLMMAVAVITMVIGRSAGAQAPQPEKSEPPAPESPE